MSTLKRMYRAKEFAPPTKLLESISAEATQIVVQDSSVFSPPPNLATISVGGEGEVIRYGGLEGNVLTNVERGIRGEAKHWEAGSAIARRYSSEDHDIFVDNIEALDKALDETTRNFLITRPPIVNCRDINLEAGWHNVDGNTLNTPWNLSRGGLFKIELPNGRIKLEFHAFADGEVWESIYDTSLDNDGFTQVDGWSHWAQIGNPSRAMRTITFNNVALSILQTILDRMPKNLMESYIINVSAGIIETGITITGFVGQGSITINGATNIGVSSHTTNGRLIIESCNCRFVQINGITSASGGNVGVFSANSCESRIIWANCNATAIGAIGFSATRVSAIVEAISCMVSSKTESAFTADRTQGMLISDPSGTNNAFIYRAVNSGVIRVLSEGTISTTVDGRYANLSTGGGRVYNSFGEIMPHWGTNTGSLATARSFTIAMSELRSFIFGLPRYLTGIITINVLPGTAVSNIQINNFEGPGGLIIQTATVLGVPSVVEANTTHLVPAVTGNANTCGSGITVRGFRCTSEANLQKINFVNCSTYLSITHMHITHGVPSGSMTIGIDLSSCRGALLSNNTVSNQQWCFRANRTPMISVGTNYGTGNNATYLTQTGSEFREMNDIRPTAIAFATRQTAGDVVTSDMGREIVRPRLHGVSDLGVASRAFRTVFATTSTIQTSDEREKEVIGSLPDNALEILMQLNPVAFRRKDDPTGEIHWGLIAQEVEAVLNKCYAHDPEYVGISRFSEKQPGGLGVVTRQDIFETVETGEVIEHKTPVTRTDLRSKMVAVTKQIPKGEWIELGCPEKLVTPINIYDSLTALEYIEYETEEECFEEVEIEDFETIYERITEEKAVDYKYGVRYSEIIPLLIKIAQTQQEQIGALESKIVEMKSQIRA